MIYLNKVTVFVWNFYTNDARVKRECTALSDAGYKVNLIALKDTKDFNMKEHENVKNNFELNRIEKKSIAMNFISKFKTISIFIVLALNLLFFSLSYFDKQFILLFLLFILVQISFLKMKKIRTFIIKISTIVRMVIRGYKEKSAIYHANDLNTLPQAIICAKFRIRHSFVVYDSHEVQTDRTGYNGKSVKIIEKLLLMFVDEMIVENETRANYNVELYGFKPSILHNYSDLLNIHEYRSARIHEKLDIEENEKILLYQGGIQVGRGLEKLIEAMDYINEGHLVFIGDGKFKNELKIKAKQSLETKRIHFIDKVPLADLPSYTKDAFIGFQVLQNICYNHFSASSNKLFEYIMAEIPVIACDFPEISKVVNQNKVGIVVDSHDNKDIANAVNKIVNDKKLYEFFKKHTYSTKNLYNWENEKSCLLELYSKLK